MKQLVFIGDSLTEWYDWQRRFPEYRVSNLGIAGETVAGLLARRDRIRGRVDTPDVVFLMTGINDLANGNYAIHDAYREIVRNLTTWFKNATIVVQSVLPVDTFLVDKYVIHDANRTIAKTAHEYGATFLDVYPLFADEDGTPRPGYLSEDGVHLAVKGYAVWSGAVEQFLQKAI